MLRLIKGTVYSTIVTATLMGVGDYVNMLDKIDAVRDSYERVSHVYRAGSDSIDSFLSEVRGEP